MANVQLPKQDKDAGLKLAKQGTRYVAVYDPEIALKILERLADGELLRDICAKGGGMPTPMTFHRWVVNDPALAIAYDAALKLSAMAMEEEAINLGRIIVKARKDGTQVQAYKVAMDQLRWSAQRRDPSRYAERGPVSIHIPIQINTTLDLAQDKGGGSTAEHPNIYALEARVVTEATAKPAPSQDAPTTPILPTKPVDPHSHPKREGGPAKLPTFGQMMRGETGDKGK